MKRLGCFALGAVLWGAVTPRTVLAQDGNFSLDRLRIGAAPEDGVGVWRAEMDEIPRFFGSFALGLSWNPLRIENHIDDENDRRKAAAKTGAPVREQLTGYFDIGFEAWERFQFQVMFPATFVQTGNKTNVAGVSSDAADLEVAAPGDLRFEARGVIVKTADKFYKLAANANLFAPSGNELSFTGDDTPTGGFGLSTEFDWKAFILTLNVGANFRPEADLNDLDISHELTYGLAGFLPFRDDRVRIGLEVFGSTAVAGPDAFTVNTTPLEWMVEGRFTLDDAKQVWMNGWGGSRLTPGYAPDFRTGLSIGYWFNIGNTDPPSPERKLPVDVFQSDIDTDKDGYPDNMDLCPTEPEDGKPPYTTDGCPAPPDKDGDGYPDSSDKCPERAEDFDKVDDADGCPEDDADKDNIGDAQDACPKEPGEPSPEKDQNGCPKFIRRIAGSNEIQVLKKVEFETGSAKLTAASYPILDEVYRLLVANPDIGLLSVEGHTDSAGSDASNLTLSKNRAKSCLDYLVGKGIVASRLTSEGFGETKPIETNDTVDGRAKNRRTEFHIKSQSSSTTVAAPGANAPVPGGD